MASVPGLNCPGFWVIFCFTQKPRPLNLKIAVELYYDRLILEFKGIFAEICLTVGWLLLSPNFGKNPFKFGVLAALATSSTAVFRLNPKTQATRVAGMSSDF